ncbi:DUF892 family protein [Variovorax sp. RHLX14]|uniref:DUF892 family protein n=1 Tax=Variovorax sp. RHLX14 TaxID=1259731 RepID=UPI003F48DAD7
MAKENFIKWHIAGLHALRSASEQGVEAAHELHAKAGSADVRSLLEAYAATAARQQEAFVGFLKELDAEPNDFKDRIMEGTNKGISEMVKAAPDQDLVDMSAVRGAMSGLDYYIGAFTDQSALSAKLGYADQARKLSSLSEAAQQLRDRFADAADTIREKAATEA